MVASTPNRIAIIFSGIIFLLNQYIMSITESVAVTELVDKPTENITEISPGIYLKLFTTTSFQYNYTISITILNRYIYEAKCIKSSIYEKTQLIICSLDLGKSYYRARDQLTPFKQFLFSVKYMTKVAIEATAVVAEATDTLSPEGMCFFTKLAKLNQVSLN